MHSLDRIGAFEFGERLNIVRLDGTRVELRHLDTMLECIQDEFKAADTYDFKLFLMGRKKQNLVLKPRAVMGLAWNRHIVRACNQIRDWVTEYTLSEEWPQEVLELDQQPIIAQGRNRT